MLHLKISVGEYNFWQKLLFLKRYNNHNICLNGLINALPLDLDYCIVYVSNPNYILQYYIQAFLFMYIPRYYILLLDPRHDHAC